MHAETQEILSRRLPTGRGFVAREIAESKIAISYGADPVNSPYSVVVDEDSQQYFLCGAKAGCSVKRYLGKGFQKEWREVLYSYAIEALKNVVGRVLFPADATRLQLTISEDESLRADLPEGWIVRTATSGIILISAVGPIGEMAHVSIDEQRKRYSLGICLDVGSGKWIAPPKNRNIFKTACEALRNLAVDRVRCVVLGNDDNQNKLLFEAAMRFGLGRLAAIGDRRGEFVDLVEDFSCVERFPRGTQPPIGDVVIFDNDRIGCDVRVSIGGRSKGGLGSSSISK